MDKNMVHILDCFMMLYSTNSAHKHYFRMLNNTQGDNCKNLKPFVKPLLQYKDYSYGWGYKPV
jgi:hypothetical protein